jgi:protein-disulfide isomerase
MTRTRTTPSTPATAREKAALLRAEAERTAARRRARVVTVVVAAVVALAVGAVVAVQQSRHDAAVAAAARPAGVPRNLLPDGGVAAVLAGAARPPAGTRPVTVELWEDFQCPACREFETAHRATLERWARQGVVQLVYKPVSFLDRASTTQYSSRAMNAAAAVVDAAPAAFPAFHDLLFTHQPAEGGAGLTDAELVDLAVRAGAPRDAVASALAGRRFQGWVGQRTEDFSRRYTGTPTTVVDGVPLPPDDPRTVVSATSLRAAVTKAAAAKGLPAPA